MWIIALLLSIVVNLIITKVIMTKITDKTEHSFMYIEDEIKTNSDFADRYIEQLHTKITELEVTLQNIVNKI